jgi:lipid-binding SYLF domain-containing protein
VKPASSLPHLAVAAGLLLAIASVPFPSRADSAQELDGKAEAALRSLLAKNPRARSISEKAVAVMVFPKVTKAGLGIGGQYGEGVLYRKGKVAGYYSTAGGSVGLQAGAQVYGYVLFFLSERDLAYVNDTEGFEVGVGPSVVLGDEGAGKATTTTTLKDAIYAFIFDQKGAMAALGIQGNKISKIRK